MHRTYHQHNRCVVERGKHIQLSLNGKHLFLTPLLEIAYIKLTFETCDVRSKQKPIFITINLFRKNTIDSNISIIK